MFRQTAWSTMSSTSLPDLQGRHTVLCTDRDAKARTIYTAVSLACMMLLSFMFGSRARHLRLNMILKTNLTRLLVITLYVMAMCFVFSSAIIQHGLGLGTEVVCHSAILLCLACYLGGKLVMYFFLVERAHALRAPYMRRSKDMIWMVGIVSVTLGLGAITIAAFFYPMSEVSEIDGTCRIGVPLKVTIPLLTYDIIINTALTGVFVYHLLPSLLFGMGEETNVWRRLTPRCIVQKLEPGGFNASSNRLSIQEANRSMKWLAWKSAIGAVLVLLPTMANMGLLFHLRGHEVGWLCLTLCTLDTTFGVCVVHWLTVDPLEVEGKIGALIVSREQVSLHSSGCST